MNERIGIEAKINEANKENASLMAGGANLSGICDRQLSLSISSTEPIASRCD